MPENRAELLPYSAVPHPRWCDRAACSVFRVDDVCHRSVARTVDSSGGRVSVWVESWDAEGGATSAPAVVVEAGGQGCGAILYPAEAIDLILALAYQVGRATGAPRGWRRLRAQRFRDQADRLLSRLPGGAL